MITAEQFVEAYNKYPPSNFEIILFKYFSQSTKPENKWLSRTLSLILLIPFTLAFIGSVAGWHHKYIEICTYIFAGMLVPFGVLWIVTWFDHNLRIRQIRKLLGVSKLEYNNLVKLYRHLV